MAMRPSFMSFNNLRQKQTVEGMGVIVTYSRSSELPLFYWPYITDYYLSVVKCLVLQPIQNMTTFMVYVAASDIKKSFSIDKTIEILGRLCFPIHE